MTAEAGQADRRRQLAHEQIDDQQTSGGGRLDAGDPDLRAFAQAVPFEQPDHRERQQDDEWNVAGLDEAGADRRENFLGRKVRRERGGDCRRGHDQHRIEPQQEADDDDGHANERP